MLKRKLWKKFGIILKEKKSKYPLQESREEQKSRLIKTLKKIDFLKDLKEEDFKYLADKLKLKLYTKDEIIFHQGDLGDDFYIIKSGKVEIIVKNIQGEEIFKRVLEKENFFGEMSILTGEPRSAAIKTLEDAELLILRKEDLQEFLINNQALEEKISKKIARRQMRTKKHLEEFELEKITFTQEEEAEIESLSAQIFNKIRNFFSF
ncbi:MAG: cyclic nucleotide-binding domain-containing protein [Armatimonadetes bacterium]|nr:cyclic nucleotide-binding domain-containing protein [Armatimonadota bacterium]